MTADIVLQAATKKYGQDVSSSPFSEMLIKHPDTNINNNKMIYEDFLCVAFHESNPQVVAG